MMPAFHHEHIIASVDVMFEEAGVALADWRPGQTIDVYEWTRNLAMRIAMRALLGLDPDDRGRGEAAAEHFERALSYYGIEYPARLLRGPGSPWRKMHRSRKILDEILFEEIRRRRASGADDSFDILGLLLEATDEDGSKLSDQEIRDQAITLMFAGHDTTTSTVSFLLYELSRSPGELQKLTAEQDEVLGGSSPDAMTLEKGLPRLEMVMDETLRLYPPAWIGPRRAMVDYEFAGHTVKAGQLRPLLLVGEPPAASGVPGSRGVRAGALHQGAKDGAPARRLHPIRRGLAHLHRQALRPDGGEGDRDGDPSALPAGADPRPEHARAPDADPEPRGRSRDGRARALTT